MLLIVSAVCGGPRSPMDVGAAAVFTDEGATDVSGYEGTEPKIELEKRGGLWIATIYQGRQPSTGYAIWVERAVHVGTGVNLRARFTTPPEAGMPVVATSPAHSIGLPWGLPDAIYLYDQNDQKRAEWVRP